MFHIRISDTTKDAELQALNTMKNRPQLRYFVHMDKVSTKFDLAQTLPHLLDMRHIKDETLRRSAARVHTGFNDNQLQALESLKTLPGRIFWMSGYPGAGKTHTALSFAGLSQMTTRPIRVLYLVDIDKAVDEVAERMANLYDSLEMNKTVVRMHNWPKEIRLAGKQGR